MIENSLKTFNLPIRLIDNKPIWLQYGYELGLCSEEQSDKIFYYQNVWLVESDKIIEKFQLHKNNLQYKINKNEELKTQYIQAIRKLEIEFNLVKHLLDKPTEYWNSLKQEIEVFYVNKIYPLEKEIEPLKAKLQELEKTLIAEAQLICCTLVRASYDENLINCAFDVLVVDEVSMASLPHKTKSLQRQ